MADKQINELPAAPQLTDDALIIVYIPGSSDPAQVLTGKQFKEFARDGVSAYVESAKSAAEDAQKAVEDVGTAVDDTKANSEAAAEAEKGAVAARSAIENMLVEAITLETGQPATVSKELVDGVVKLVFGLPAGRKGDPGDPGSSIKSIARTAGNGAPGTTDTYTVTLTDGSTTEFYVYNGKDGTGAGDMTASVYDPQGKAQDVYAYADDAVNAAKSKAVPVTLTADGWDAATLTQTVAVPGVSADENAQLIQPVPASASQTAYIEAGILCTGQAADSLTFAATTVPTVDLAVYVVITGVQA